MKLTIQEKWWSDPRRTHLCSLVGNLALADGLAVQLWRLAQEHNGLIPDHIWQSMPCKEHLLACNLVANASKCSEMLAYVRGSGDLLAAKSKRAAAARKQRLPELEDNGLISWMGELASQACGDEMEKIE
jgi:hypothetical protein